MQIIGIRPDSTFRVPSDWFLVNSEFEPGRDPTTGGPLMVVHDNTDVHADDYLLDHDQTSPTYRQVIRASTPAHHMHLARTARRFMQAVGAAALEAGAKALEAGEDSQ